MTSIQSNQSEIFLEETIKLISYRYRTLTFNKGGCRTLSSFTTVFPSTDCYTLLIKCMWKPLKAFTCISQAKLKFKIKFYLFKYVYFPWDSFQLSINPVLYNNTKTVCCFSLYFTFSRISREIKPMKYLLHLGPGSIL